MELTEEEMSRLNAAARRMSAKMRAVRIVSASSVSKRDLQQRLVQKGEDPQAASEAVAWMEEMDLVDDRKTAEMVVQRCIAKGYGPARAKQALYEKQIPKSLWEDALADYPDMLEEVVSYLRGKVDDVHDAKAVKRGIDACMRRGHSYGVIRQALQILSADTEDWMGE